MVAESKIVITAEDRTAAAFAAVERNTGKAALAMGKLTSNMLAVAGAGSLIAFFKHGAESTEVWRDEMARLDDITKEFFNTAADTGRLAPYIEVMKKATLVALGGALALENFGLAAGSMAASYVAMAKLQFDESRKITELANQDMAANTKRFEDLRDLLNAPAPQGYVKAKEAEVERIKQLNEHLKRSEEQRLKMTLDNAQAAEDAIRAENELSPEITGAGSEAMVQKIWDEKFAKEQELRLKSSEENQKQRDKDIEALLTSQLTESELINQKYANDLQSLYDARESEYLTEAQFKLAREELETEHQAKLGNISAQGVIERHRFEQMNTMQQSQFIVGQLLSITQGVAAHNKTMFKINKAAGIANATINTYQGVTKALSAYPPPWSLAMAAVQLAAGMAQVQQIKSADFGGSTSAPSIGGGGAIPTTSADVPALPPSQQAAPARNISVVVQSDSGMVSTAWIRDTLMPSINDALGDGVTLNVAAT